MKQLEQETVRPDLMERNDGRVVEAAKGLFQYSFEVREGRDRPPETDS